MRIRSFVLLPAAIYMLIYFFALEATGFTGDIYADPSRAVFRKLGMTNESLKGTPKGEKKRSYVTSVLSNVFKSVWVNTILLGAG